MQAILLKINAKTLEHPEPCSVLGTWHYPRTGVGGGGVPISDFIRLAGVHMVFDPMANLPKISVLYVIAYIATYMHHVL